MTLFQTFFPEFSTYSLIEYNLVESSKNEILLELSVPGFSEKEIEIQVVDDILHISAKNQETRKYLHRGISKKSFNYKFNLRDDVVVKPATIKNGILSIPLEIKYAKGKAPKKIPVMH